MNIEIQSSKLITEGGYLNFTEEGNEITIDIVCANIPRKGIGSALVKKMQEIASDKGKKIGLYAEPCAMCSTKIDDEALRQFYFHLGFELDKDDIDGKLMVWNG